MRRLNKKVARNLSNISFTNLKFKKKKHASIILVVLIFILYMFTYGRPYISTFISTVNDFRAVSFHTTYETISIMKSLVLNYKLLQFNTTTTTTNDMLFKKHTCIFLKHSDTYETNKNTTIILFERNQNDLLTTEIMINFLYSMNKAHTNNIYNDYARIISNFKDIYVVLSEHTHNIEQVKRDLLIKLLIKTLIEKNDQITILYVNNGGSISLVDLNTFQIISNLFKHPETLNTCSKNSFDYCNCNACTLQTYTDKIDNSLNIIFNNLM